MITSELKTELGRYAGVRLLQKPYEPEELLRQLREMLGATDATR
ncbi:MAG: hypothetical protein NT045_05220 [Candidatus Aureabacteria bacterium]|nr:hypothetical protein [Candidatus Auribacterota bacterium]